MEHSAVESTDEVLAEGSVFAGLSAGEILNRFAEGIEALCGIDPGALSDGDTVIELSKHFDRLEAVVTRATARFDAEGGETLAGRICQLADGTAISPGSLIRWANEAWIERIVFNTPSRVIDVGQRRRLFAGATRRAIQVRDRECFHDFCDTPADRCDIDHVMAHSEGGLTTEANGRVACGFHNRQRNHDSGRERGP